MQWYPGLESGLHHYAGIESLSICRTRSEVLFLYSCHHRELVAVAPVVFLILMFDTSTERSSSSWPSLSSLRGLLDLSPNIQALKIVKMVIQSDEPDLRAWGLRIPLGDEPIRSCPARLI